MKKLTILSVAALMFVAPNVMAEDDGARPEKQGGKMFAQRDLDGDGYISKDEFLASAKKRFSEIDSNGDGKVSKDEAKAHRKEMKKKIKGHREKMEERRNKSSDD